jgi:predicted fused transcriptional regulator/phosphomethylpyrimidine kinase
MMTDTSATQNAVPTIDGLITREKALDLRLKEIEVANKEYEQKHRPNAYKSLITNPAVIAAAIAAWATLSGAGLTWLSGRIAADAQREAAVQQAELERLKFEANLITDSVKTGNPDQAAVNLQFLVNTGLLSGSLGEKVMMYLRNRKPGEGRMLPSN